MITKTKRIERKAEKPKFFTKDRFANKDTVIGAIEVFCASIGAILVYLLYRHASADAADMAKLLKPLMNLDNGSNASFFRVMLDVANINILTILAVCVTIIAFALRDLATGLTRIAVDPVAEAASLKVARDQKIATGVVKPLGK